MLRTGARCARRGRSARRCSSSTAVVFTATHVNLDTFNNELNFRGDAHASLTRAARRPGGPGARAALRPALDAQPQAGARLALDPRRRRPAEVIARSRPERSARRDRPRRGDLRRPEPLCARASPTATSPTQDTLTQVPLAGLHAAGGDAVLRARMSAAERPPEPAPARPAAVRQRRWPWRLALGARPRRRARPAALGLPAGPAVRLQRRRERALRARRDRHVRARLEPELLRQPAGLHVPAARRRSRSGSAAAAGVRGARGRPDGRCSSLARRAAAARRHAGRGLLYLAGARLFDRRVGLLAAALLAVAFLPVFYSHLALNDVPTLAPLCLSLSGIAGVFRDGRLRDYALAGRRARARVRDQVHGRDRARCRCWRAAAHRAGRSHAARCAAARGPRAGRRRRARGVPGRQPVRAARPRTVPRRAAAPGRRRRRRLRQARPDAEHGLLYYLWTFTWGLGWVPLVAALGGAGAARRRDRRALLVLVPAPILFVLFMGTQARYFGRWLLPVFPIACLLAA